MGEPKMPTTRIKYAYCPYCSKRFKSEQEVIDHAKNKHGVELSFRAVESWTKDVSPPPGAGVPVPDLPNNPQVPSASEGVARVPEKRTKREATVNADSTALIEAKKEVDEMPEEKKESKKEMNECGACGNTFEGKPKFCPECGEALEWD